MTETGKRIKLTWRIGSWCERILCDCKDLDGFITNVDGESSPDKWPIQCPEHEGCDCILGVEEDRMPETQRLYAVIFELQEKQIMAWCWGSCGHGIAGAIDLGPDPPLTAVPCRHSPCPHLVREMDEAMGDVRGEGVYLRKLEEVSTAAGEAIQVPNP